MIVPAGKRSLATMLLEAWRFWYPTKYAKYAVYEMRARERKGIPAPFVEEDL